MSEREAPSIRSISDGTRTIEQIAKAIEFAGRGFKPFSYSFFFDDHHNQNRTGPITGIVWAKDETDALRFVGVDMNGGRYGYEIEIKAEPWSADNHRACATPGCKNDPGGNGYDEYLHCDICHQLRTLQQSLKSKDTPVAGETPVVLAPGRHNVGYR